MKDYLLDVMNKSEKGLFLLQLPTGNGKTYNSVQAIKNFSEIANKRKIIYLTTLNKNLPEEDFKKAFGSEDLYNKNVLRLRSNFDEVVDKILDLDVPEEMQTESYESLCKAVKEYKSALSKKISDKRYINILKDDVNNAERIFRKFIYNLLKNNFSTASKRKYAIKTDKKYKWIGKLYPAVFTDDYKIIMMSISKFMKRNSVVYDSSYKFLNSKILDNAVIFIDEFDATKDTIKKEIIDSSLSFYEDYIQLFLNIFYKFQLKNLSSDMQQAIKQVEKTNSKNTYDSLKKDAEKILINYNPHLSIKTKDFAIDKRQAFMFNDGTFHTVLKEGANYIRSTFNEEDNRIDIFFEDKDTFYKNRNPEKDISLYSMLRDINMFLFHFKLLILEWAKNYMNIINSTRNSTSDAMSIENSVKTVLNCLGINENQSNFLMNDAYLMSNKKNENFLDIYNFYQKGMEYYEFEDNDSHNDNTILKYIKVADTPEKIILYLARKATVIGVSATAEINTVVGNYNLEYLNEQLRENFHRTPDFLKEKTEDSFKERWSAYENGKINIYGEIINDDEKKYEPLEYCKTFMDDELARYSVNLIINTISDNYYVLRYCNLLRVMCTFNKNKDMQSLLYLGMALPKNNNPQMDIDLLMKLFEFSKCANNQIDSSIFFLSSDNFEENKEELQNRLSSGEKIFVMSSYQTIGAGQNLQYKIPLNREVVYLGNFNKNDSRFLYKDFDATYLGDITNMSVNTYKGKISANELIEMLFQIEDLYENGELNNIEKNQMLKLAFRSYANGEESQFNKLYQKKSIIMQSNRMVLQAIGRMCRTFVKSKNIYLFIDAKLLSKLYTGELKKNILPPEMKKLVAMRETLGAEYTSAQERILCLAEKTSSESLWGIKRLLAKDWTETSMKLWENLRTLVLTYPTADLTDRENIPEIKRYYITGGSKLNQYIYSQYSDFSYVTIDFENDRVAFKNSKRVQYKGNTDELAIYEMSEKNSGLTEVLKYPGMKDYFISHGYALSFIANDYLMSPVLFHNIYKGALGEVAGKFILQKELGINLNPITDPQYFEFFDYKLSDDVYIDFKNWKFTYVEDKDKIRRDILSKANAIGAKRVYVINIVSNKDYKPSNIVNEKLVEIPKLINDDGTVCYENLHKIHREDFENANE